jgi:hypothetical protein
LGGFFYFRLLEKRFNKNGRPYYYDAEQKRIVSNKEGSKVYVRENLNFINKGRKVGISYDSLTSQEKRTYNAQNRYRENGKFVSRLDASLAKKAYKEITGGENLPKAIDLNKAFGTRSLRETLGSRVIEKSFADNNDQSNPFKAKDVLIDEINRGTEVSDEKGNNGFSVVQRMMRDDKELKKEQPKAFYIYFMSKKFELDKDGKPTGKEIMFIDFSRREIITSE